MRVRFYILALIIFAQVTTTCAKTFIVCVGISDYPGYYNDLMVSDNDATTMARLYKNNVAAEVVCLTNRQATVSNIVNAMKTMYSRAGSDDTVILYFSGHGQKGVFKCYDRSMPFSTITDCMKLSNSRKRIVFADACMSGSMRRGNRRSGSSDISLMFFLSSRTSEPSREMAQLRNSVFTSYLLRGLQGSADSNHDNLITAKELFTYVSNQVISLTHQRQHPVMWGNFSDNMVVMNLNMFRR